jgi:hypothetical protein
VNPPGPELPHASIQASTLRASEGQFILFDGSGASGGTIAWRTIPECLTIVGEGGKKLGVAASPPFDVIQVVSNGKDFDVDVVQVLLKEPPGPPKPPPGPTPPPTPPPGPTAAKLFVTVWRDFASVKPEEVAIYTNKGLEDAITAKHLYRIYDVSSPDFVKKNIRPHIEAYKAAGGKLPAVVVQDHSGTATAGTVLSVQPLPASVADFIAMVTTFEGK